MARIGVMKALNRHVERVFNPDRKDLCVPKIRFCNIDGEGRQGQVVRRRRRGCVYRKLKLGCSGGESRQGWRVI